MKLLFIGNSHTYVNDMPHLFQEICTHSGIQTEITMLAHGGMGFDFHAQQPEVRFNLLFGNYDYVILQHVAHPFGEEAVMFSAARELFEIIEKTAAKAILYMTWSEKRNPEGQTRMTEAYLRLGRELKIPVAPVGIAWQSFRASNPEQELYSEDGEHASLIGSSLAAYTIAATIFGKAVTSRTPEEQPLLDQVFSTITSGAQE